MNDPNKEICKSSGSIVIKICNGILFLIIGFMTFVFFIGPHPIVSHFGWYEIALITIFIIPIISKMKRAKAKDLSASEGNDLQWKNLDRKGKIYWGSIIAV